MSLDSIRRVYIRILLFYIGGVLVIGLLVPYTDPGLNLKESTAAKSPFVIAIKAAGIKGLPSVINAALLTSAWSAASSDVYSSSRALCESYSLHPYSLPQPVTFRWSCCQWERAQALLARKPVGTAVRRCRNELRFWSVSVHGRQ